MEYGLEQISSDNIIAEGGPLRVTICSFPISLCLSVKMLFVTLWLVKSDIATFTYICTSLFLSLFF